MPSKVAEPYYYYIIFNYNTVNSFIIKDFCTSIKIVNCCLEIPKNNHSFDHEIHYISKVLF